MSLDGPWWCNDRPWTGSRQWTDAEMMCRLKEELKCGNVDCACEECEYAKLHLLQWAICWMPHEEDIKQMHGLIVSTSRVEFIQELSLTLGYLDTDMYALMLNNSVVRLDNGWIYMRVRLSAESVAQLVIDGGIDGVDVVRCQTPGLFYEWHAGPPVLKAAMNALQVTSNECDILL